MQTEAHEVIGGCLMYAPRLSSSFVALRCCLEKLPWNAALKFCLEIHGPRAYRTTLCWPIVLFDDNQAKMYWRSLFAVLILAREGSRHTMQANAKSWHININIETYKR